MSTQTPIPPAPPQTGSRRPRRRWWLLALVVPLLLVVIVMVPFAIQWIIMQRGPTTTTDCVKAADPSRSGAVTEYCLSTRTQPPHAMTVGPDGNLWFTDSFNSKLVRVTPQGVITQFSVPARPVGDSAVPGIARGADGNLWYIAEGKLGRVSPQGATGTVALPAGVVVTSLTAGPDGNLWLSESRSTGSAAAKTSDTIAKMTPAGEFTAYSLTPAGLTSAGGLIPGPDGNVWFVGTTAKSAAIGRITPAGVVTVFPVDIPLQTKVPGYPICEPVDTGPCIGASNIGGLVAGADGNLWFVDGQGRIGRTTPSGVTTFFDTASAWAPVIGAGPDGAVWYPTTSSPNGPVLIGRITPDGTITRFTLPHNGLVSQITAGPDGGVWFLLIAGGGNEPQSTQRIVRVTP